MTAALYTPENMQTSDRDFWSSPHPFGPKDLGLSRVDGVYRVWWKREVVVETDDAQVAADIANAYVAAWRAETI